MIKSYWLLAFLAVPVCGSLALAGNNDSLFVEQVTGAAEFFTEEAPTERIEQLQQFIEEPLLINLASKEELSVSGLFNDFQIFSILDYRQRYGGVLSAGELSALIGFNGSVVAPLLPYLSFEQQEAGRFFRHPQGQLQYTITLPAETDSAWLGHPTGILLRGKLSPQQGVQAGFVVEKDPGEEWVSSGGGPDLSSGFIQLTSRNGRFVVTGGDFQARFGQGLALWTGYVPYQSSTLSQNIYKPAGISPNYSRNENGYLRGLAIRFSGKSLHICSYYSQRWRDAVLETDSANNPFAISSIVVTGLHRTPAEVAHFRALTDRLIGSSLGWQGRKFLVNMGAFGHFFDRPVSLKNSNPGLINHSNYYLTVHTDYLLMAGNHQLIGEVAFNPGGGVAMAHHLYTEIFTHVQYILSYRYHSSDYFSFFANGRNTLTPEREAEGLVQGVECRFPNLVGVSVLSGVHRSVADDATGFKHGYIADILGTLVSHWRGPVGLHLKYRYQGALREVAGEHVKSGPKHSLRGDITYRPSEYWWIRPRIDWRRNGQLAEVSEGWMVSAETGCRGREWPWGLTVQWSRFRTDDFNSAIYAWQTDVLYEIGFPASYGNGYRTAISFFYKAGKRWRIAFSYANHWKLSPEQVLSVPEEAGARFRGQILYNW